MKPKILLFDIENAPGTAYIWQCKTDYINPKMLKDEWYMLCWAAKWLGEKKVMSSALYEHKGYKKDRKSDKHILNDLWKLLDKADIVIAHNGMAFDCKKANARFIRHGIEPPSPYRVIDTLKEARKHFMFMSNTLDELGRVLGVGGKMRTGGFDLWVDCMNGDIKAWKKMVRYCKRDVLLLEKVYLKLRPYMKSHPNLSIIRNNISCGKCGGKHLQCRGYSYTNAGKKQRFQCMNSDCRGWGNFLIGKSDVVKGVRN